LPHLNHHYSVYANCSSQVDGVVHQTSVPLTHP
jgi:hypothetical protein